MMNNSMSLVDTESDTPDIGQMVIIYLENKKAKVAKYVGEGFFMVGLDAISSNEIVTWIPLPNQPKIEHPLTLEELKQMDRKSIWIEDLLHPERSEWTMDYFQIRKRLVILNKNKICYVSEKYGVEWEAYLRPSKKIYRIIYPHPPKEANR